MAALALLCAAYPMEQILRLSAVYLSTSTGQDTLCATLDQTSKALAVNLDLRSAA